MNSHTPEQKLESVATRLERRAREVEKARAFTDEERAQRRCMVVIYMEISNMIRAECKSTNGALTEGGPVSVDCNSKPNPPFGAANG